MLNKEALALRGILRDGCRTHRTNERHGLKRNNQKDDEPYLEPDRRRGNSLFDGAMKGPERKAHRNNGEDDCETDDERNGFGRDRKQPEDRAQTPPAAAIATLPARPRRRLLPQ